MYIIKVMEDVGATIISSLVPQVRKIFNKINNNSPVINIFLECLEFCLPQVGPTEAQPSFKRKI